MKNVVKDIETNCPDCSPEEIVSFLVDNGDLSTTSNYHREIYFFYKECRKERFTHREARRTTIELFNIGPTKFKKIIRRVKGH